MQPGILWGMCAVPWKASADAIAHPQTFMASKIGVHTWGDLTGYLTRNWSRAPGWGSQPPESIFLSLLLLSSCALICYGYLPVYTGWILWEMSTAAEQTHRYLNGNREVWILHNTGRFTIQSWCYRRHLEAMHFPKPGQREKNKTLTGHTAAKEKSLLQ